MKNPLVMAFLLGSVGIIIHLLVIIIQGGWIPVYPYIT
jgi:preprotein translocase subunit Sss1